MRRSLPLSLAVLFFLFVTNSLSFGQLNGTYTINGSSAATASNYQNFASAVNDMVNGSRTDGGAPNGPNISGAVLFNVAAGTYTEQVTIPSIAGASAANTITFDGGSATTTKVTQVGSFSGDYTVRLNGADFIHLTNLNIENTGISYGFGVQLLNQADNNEISYCDIDLPSTGTNNYQIGVIAGATYTNYSLNASYLNIHHCDISGGRYNIAVSGPSGTQAQGLVVDSNSLSDAYYAALRVNYINEPQITNNAIDLRTVYNFAYGMYLYYSSEMNIHTNTISNPGSYGIYQYQTNFNSNTPSLIYNNMIGGNYRSTGTAYGLYMSSCRYVEVYHNSVLVDNPGGGSRGFYVTGSASVGVDIRNNSFATTNTGSSGYAFYVSSPSYVQTVDYNNYYTNGPTLCYFGGVYSDLASLQTAQPSFNQNSQFGWPNYNSSSDLHTFGTALSNWAFNLASVNTDIDGEPRPLPPDPTKDVGADEFVLPPFDLDMISIVSPSVLQIGNNTVEVLMQNNGINSLNGQVIAMQYSTDGGLTWPVTETFTPTTLGSSGTQENFAFSTLWNITTGGTYAFCVRVNPQVIGDPDASDELCASVCTGMGGNYTINTLLPTGGTNFQSFSDAAVALSSCGIGASVTLTAAAGTYNEYFTIGEILGASATNTVTFDGVTAAQCTLSYSFSSTNEALVKLDGTDYTTFKNLTLDLPGAYGYGVWFRDGADFNEISDCEILMPITSVTSYNVGVLMGDQNYYSYGNNGNNNLIQNNIIQGGYYGARLNGLSTQSYNTGNKFYNNEITEFYYCGLYARYQARPEYVGNTISGRSGAGSTFGYGIYAYYLEDDFRIENNRVFSVGGSALYMGYVNYYNNLGHGVVSNNMLGGGFASSGTVYGIRCYNAKDVDFINNSINIGGNNGYAFYLSGSSTGVDSLRIVNNILAADGYFNSGGLALYVTSVAGAGVDELDYNLYYSTGASLVNYNGFTFSDLASFQTSVTNHNQNSVEDQPGFISETDLHLVCSPIDDLGTLIGGITEDIDGESRNASTPDIGADEFTSITITYDIGGDTSGCDLIELWSDTTNFVGFMWGGGQNTPNLNVDTTGMYSVTVVDSNNCRATDSLLVTIFDAPVVPFGNDTISQCSYDSIDALNNGSSFVWNTSDTSQVIVPPASGTYTVDITTGDGCSITDMITIDLFADAVAQLGPDTTFCLGAGTILNGGSGPTGTTYSWSSGASTQVVLVSAPGNYSVTVTTPQGCMALDSVFLNALLAPVVELGADRTECDQFTLDAGTSGTTYLWSTNHATQTISPGQSGTYMVTVTNADGCQSVDQVVIALASSPTVSLGPDQILCANDVVVLDAGNAGFNYQWSTGANSQTITSGLPGLFFCQVTDPVTGCTGTDTISLQQSFVSVNLGTDFFLCDGETAQLDAGSGGTAFLWQDGQTIQVYTVTGPGVYDVQVTDNAGCVDEDTITVTAATPPTAAFSSPANAPLFQSVQFTDGSAASATSWFWDFGDGITSTQQNPSHQFLAIGTFQVCLTISDGTCETTICNSISVGPPIGVEDEFFANSVLVYPNPNQGNFSIDFDLPKPMDLHIELYNLTGQKLLNIDLDAVRILNEDIDISQQAAGLYFLRITSKEGNEMIRKVVVE